MSTSASWNSDSAHSSTSSHSSRYNIREGDTGDVFVYQYGHGCEVIPVRDLCEKLDKGRWLHPLPRMVDERRPQIPITLTGYQENQSLAATVASKCGSTTRLTSRRSQNTRTIRTSKAPWPRLVCRHRSTGAGCSSTNFRIFISSPQNHPQGAA